MHSKHKRKCYKKQEKNKRCKDNDTLNTNYPHNFPINNVSNFAMEIHNRPYVHKNADELRYRFHRRNFMGHHLRHVRNQYELKPALDKIDNHPDKYLTVCRENNFNYSKHKSKPNKFLKFKNTSPKDDIIHKINREFDRRQNAFVHGKGLHAPFKGLYMKW